MNLAESITPSFLRADGLAGLAAVTPGHTALIAEVEDAAAAAYSRVGLRSPVDLVTPTRFLGSLARAGLQTVTRPVETASAFARAGMTAAGATFAAAGRAVGAPTTPVISPKPRDPRFRDKAWQENAAYSLLLQLYLTGGRLVEDLLDVAALPVAEDRRARFAAGLILDTCAPTNTFLGNPRAVQRAFETGGTSVLRGASHALHDLVERAGWPAQVASGRLEVGRDLAATPGHVVYRNELMELIEYAPQTDEVHEVPLLFCPPWINKYYIVDLAPGRSLVEWAVQHGHRCFVISYRNPSAAMADTSFDDYLTQGPLTALQAVKETTDQAEVNLLSVCLGGTLSAVMLSHLAQRGDTSVRSATYLNTLTDFREPGLLGAFVDEEAVTALERRMARTGYLDARSLSRTFDLLRANDLIFTYVAKRWLQGEGPDAFDLLAWNADATNLPARMQSEYLRSCYVANDYAEGRFTTLGATVEPGAITVDSYALAAIDDHIVPWRSAYASAQLYGGDTRFVLSSSGHIAGIVNPPSPKARHWTNDAIDGGSGVEADTWFEGADQHTATWWDDWATWIAERAGAKIPAPLAPGSGCHPVIDVAPGLYVRERAG